MVKESEDQVATMAEARKPSVGLTPKLLGVLRCRIEELFLHGAVASLLGIQVRGVARQHLHRYFGVLTEIGLHFRRAMDLQPIPDHQQPTREPALEVPEKGHEVGTVDGMVEVAFIDPT